MLGKLCTLGRNRETYVVNSYHTFIGSHSKCDIRVYGPGISPQHCVVTTQGDSSATIRNLPHNGTTLVNARDIGMSDYSLSQNDIIKIGNTKLMWSRADGKKSSSKDSSSRLVAVVMPQKRTSDEFSSSASKKLKTGDSSLAHSSSILPFSGQWDKRSQKRSLVHSTPAVRRHSRTESFRLLSTSNFFNDSSLTSLVDNTFESERKSTKKVCFSSKKVHRKPLPSLDSPARSILKKPSDVLSTPTNVRRTKELNFRSPRNSSLRSIMASPSTTPMRHLSHQVFTEPRRVLSRTNLSSQIDALCLEKSLLAAKKLKSEPPKVMDKKKLAALLVCHKKKSPRKDFDETHTTPQPKRKSELDNLFIDMKFSTENNKSSKLSKSASSPSILVNTPNKNLVNSPSVENLSLGLSDENLNENSVSRKLSKSKSHALSQLNIDMNDSPKRSVKHSNDENSNKKSRRSKSLENNTILNVNISPKRSSKIDEKANLSRNMGVLLKRLHIDMNDFPSRRATKSLVFTKDERENKKIRSKSLGSKPTSIVSPVLEKSKSRALSRLTVDMNDSPNLSKSPERVKKDLSASLNFSPKSAERKKPLLMRAENFENRDIPQIPDLNLSLGIAKNVARILSSPLKDKAKRLTADLPESSFIQEPEKAARMSAASPSISQGSSPLMDVQEDDLLNALHLSRKSTIVEKPKQPVRRLRSSNKNLNGIQQLFSSEYKHYSKEEVKKLFDDDAKPSTSVVELKRKLYSPIPDNPNVKSMDRVFTTSPVVDYTDTSGVKRLFTISPKADYRDPRGIKELFAVSKTSYLDVSSDLFNKSKSGSSKRKSTLIQKNEKRTSLAKPQKEDTLKVRLEKKLSLKNKTQAKEEPSLKVRTTRKRNTEHTTKSAKVKKEPAKSAKRSLGSKNASTQKDSAKKKTAKKVESPAKEVKTKKRAAKVDKDETKKQSTKKATAKDEVAKEVKTRKRATKKASSPAKDIETKKKAVKRASSPIKDEKEVKTRKRTTKKDSSPAKEVETKKRATKIASSPAKEVETKKRAAKKASSPAKVVVTKKRATKKSSSPAKEVETKKRAAKKASSPAKEVVTKKRATKKASSPAKEVETKKRAAKKASSPAKEVETKKRAAKKASSPAKEVKQKKRATKKASSPAKDVVIKKRDTKKASSPSKEVETKKRAAKKASSPAKEVETKKRAAKKASSPAKEVETKKKTAKKASNPVKEENVVETKKRATKKNSSPAKIDKAPKTSSAKSKTKKAPSPAKENTKKATKKPAKSPKASPKKSSTKKPRLIVKISPPKILGSILKKPKGKSANTLAKKVLFDQSPSPKKKNTK